MSDPDIKIGEVPEAEQSGWDGQTKAAPAVSTPRNVAEWPKGAQPYSLRSMRAQAEIYAITRALEEAGWNRKRAAQMLRISYRGLLYKISSHKITRQTPKPEILGAGAFATNQIK